MTDTTTQKLITELRTLKHLTNTEAQIANSTGAGPRRSRACRIDD